MQIINGWLKSAQNYDQQFWAYNAFNINALAFHVHNGDDGDQLPPSSLLQLSDSFNTTDAETFGFSATIALPVTAPATTNFDNTTISFFDDVGARAYLNYEKIDDENYKVYSAYNTITFEARYA